MASTIPIVDISAYIQTGDTSDGEGIGQDINKALHDIGFVYLAGHGIDENLIQDYFKASKGFFDLPSEVKRKYARKKPVTELTGYQEPGDELLERGKFYEFKESFDAKAIQMKFPEETPEFSSTSKLLLDACEDLRKAVFRLLALGLELEDIDLINQISLYREDRTKSNETQLRALCYPAVPTAKKITENTIRCAEHFDWGVITFLFQDSVGGLEAQARDGTWVPVNAMPNAVLVNTGKVLEIITRGYYRATPHRVLLTNEDKRCHLNRYSTAFFVVPDSDYVIAPLPRNQIMDVDYDFQPKTMKAFFDGFVDHYFPPEAKKVDVDELLQPAD